MFERSSNVTFHENPYVASRVGPCRRTDRHDEAVCRSSQTCEEPKQELQYNIKPFKRQVKSHLPFASIISSSPYSPR